MLAWLTQLQAVREALELLDGVAADRLPPAVAGRLTWLLSPPRVRLAGHPPIRLGRARASRHGSAGYHLRWEDARHAARLFAQRLVNSGLEAHTISRLMWNPGFRFYDTSTGEESGDGRKGFELRVYPKNLLGVLWLQVGQVAEGRVHRRCAAPGCATWWVVGPTGSRSSRRTCSDACRKRASRSSQNQVPRGGRKRARKK
jgi:hypothetical protein